jgi:hypothetical protein
MRKTKRDRIKDLLDTLKPEQVEVFYRMYKSLAEITDKQVSWALQQCERTVQLNAVNKIKTLLHLDK